MCPNEAISRAGRPKGRELLVDCDSNGITFAVHTVGAKRAHSVCLSYDDAVSIAAFVDNAVWRQLAERYRKAAT
jgi:hypothetical protein